MMALLCDTAVGLRTGPAAGQQHFTCRFTAHSHDKCHVQHIFHLSQYINRFRPQKTKPQRCAAEEVGAPRISLTSNRIWRPSVAWAALLSFSKGDAPMLDRLAGVSRKAFQVSWLFTVLFPYFTESFNLINTSTRDLSNVTLLGMHFRVNDNTKK